jgi:hypothetical protein
MKKNNVKKIKDLLNMVDKVFPIEQGDLPVRPHHAVTLDQKYGLTLNIYLSDKKLFAQTCIEEENFDWNNFEVELTNLWGLIYKKENVK